MTDHLGAWRVLAERLIYEHLPWLRLREQDVALPSGVTIQRYLLTDSPDVVMMFAVTTDLQALFVEQYKHGIERLSLDLSAGYMDAEDTSPLAAAQRELREETGYVSEHWAHLATLAPEPNRSQARHHFFLAWDCRRAGAQHLDATEELRVRLIPLDAVETLAFCGDVLTVSTTAGIALGMRFWRTMSG
jgi:8-oxo-dGTP pyrophosphatase MutT (NUDIX family)